MRRVVLIAFALSAPIALALFVSEWRYGVVKGPGVYIAGQHVPTTPEERAAAAVAQQYVRAAQRGDLHAACNVAVRVAARRLRCAKEARLPRALTPGSGRLTAIDAVLQGSTGVIVIGDGSGKANFLRMRRWHGIWRVTEHRRGHTI